MKYLILVAFVLSVKTSLSQDMDLKVNDVRLEDLRLNILQKKYGKPDNIKMILVDEVLKSYIISYGKTSFTAYKSKDNIISTFTIRSQGFTLNPLELYVGKKMTELDIKKLKFSRAEKNRYVLELDKEDVVINMFVDKSNRIIKIEMSCSIPYCGYDK